MEQEQKQKIDLINDQIDFLQGFCKRVIAATQSNEGEQVRQELNMEWQVWANQNGFSVEKNEHEILMQLIIQRYDLYNPEPAETKPKRKPLTVQAVIKFIDIDINELSSATLDYLDGRESWKDCDGDMNEHLYDINEIIEEDQGLNYPEIQDDLNDMAQLMAAHDAGLVRIIIG